MISRRQLHTIPFPCAVYVRDKKTANYLFSHLCDTRAPKTAPSSLRVKDLTAFAQHHSENCAALRRACFLVLVSGDVAQCVTASNVKERRVPFLFHGSEYARPSTRVKACAEFHEGYIPLYFHSTMTIFTKGWLDEVVPFESGLILLPRVVSEQTLPTLARWVESSLTKSIHACVWCTDRGDSYNEHTRQLRRCYNNKGGESRKRKHMENCL
jgi:hypothetical protein